MNQSFLPDPSILSQGPSFLPSFIREPIYPNFLFATQMVTLSQAGEIIHKILTYWPYWWSLNQGLRYPRKTTGTYETGRFKIFQGPGISFPIFFFTFIPYIYPIYPIDWSVNQLISQPIGQLISQSISQVTHSITPWNYPPLPNHSLSHSHILCISYTLHKT